MCHCDYCVHICAGSSESLSHEKCPSPQFFNRRTGSQTLIAGRKSRERERESAWCLHTTNLLFWFGFLNLETQCLGQPINLVTPVSDEDPCADPESFVRGGPTLQL